MIFFTLALNNVASSPIENFIVTGKMALMLKYDIVPFFINLQNSN